MIHLYRLYSLLRVRTVLCAQILRSASLTRPQRPCLRCHAAHWGLIFGPVETPSPPSIHFGGCGSGFDAFFFTCLTTFFGAPFVEAAPPPPPPPRPPKKPPTEGGGAAAAGCFLGGALPRDLVAGGGGGGASGLLQWRQWWGW